MYTVFLRLLMLLCMFVSGTILACTDDEACIDKNNWHLAIAIGVGVKTNPLVDGDNIPLVILPDLAWYSEKAYFDNGELGYQWLNRPTFAFETFIRLNQERAYFSFLHPANILAPIDSSAIDSPVSPSSPTDGLEYNESSLSIDEIAKREWAIDAGIRGHYFLPNGEWQLTLLQDMTNVHKGQQIGLEYSHRWQWHKFRLGLRIGADWKSTSLIDYYYGVSPNDTDLTKLYFNGQSGWQTYFSINAQKPINKHWSWLVNIGYRRLPNSLTASPLIAQNSIRNVFLGVAYRF